jgi:hypothetical protein
MRLRHNSERIALEEAMPNVALYLARAAIASCSLIVLIPEINAQRNIAACKTAIGR